MTDERPTDEEQQQIEAYQAIVSHPFFSFVHDRHGPFLDEMLDALTKAVPREAGTPAEGAIDLMARYMLWQLVDVERVQWENYPELGEHDFERIIERIEEIAPPCPDMHERQDAYEFLSNRADGHASMDRSTDV